MGKINPDTKNNFKANFGVRAKKFQWILLSILVLGAFLRFYNLGNNSFVADEFLDINSTYGYFKTGEWKAWDFNLENPAERVNDPSDERAWAFRWQTAELFKFLPPTEATARTVSALWGVLTVFLIYLISFSFTKNRTIGLLSAFLFAVSIDGIEFDRRFRMYAMFFPVFLAFSWSLFRFFEGEYAGKVKILRRISQVWGMNILYAVPAAFLGILSIHLHQLTANIAIIFFVYVLIQMFRETKNKKPFWNKYSIAALLMVAGSLGAKIVFPAETAVYTGGLQFFNNNFSYFTKVFSDYSNAILAVLFFSLGAYHLYRNQTTQKASIWLAVSFLVTLFSAVFLWSRNPGNQYIFFAQSFKIILIAAGIFALAEFLREHLKGFGKKAFVVPLVLSLLILPNFGYFFQNNNTYHQTSESESPNYRKVFTFFKKQRKADDVLITRDFRNYYWSGEGVKTFDFGGELAKEKFSLAELREIEKNHPFGWVIISTNDDAYIANDAMEYIQKNFQRVSNVAVRGNIFVYRWGTI